MSIDQRIARLRISFKELAFHAGMHHDTVRKIVDGKDSFLTSKFNQLLRAVKQEEKILLIGLLTDMPAESREQDRLMAELKRSLVATAADGAALTGEMAV